MAGGGVAGRLSVLSFSTKPPAPLPRQVLPVSQKVHTTRRSALGVFTKEDTQLVSM